MLPIDAPMPEYAQRALAEGFATAWLITDKGDDEAWELAERHYTRQTPGSSFFTRNGQNLVFVTREGDACWVTFRPTPGKATRTDKLEAWECALFRNEGPILSSYLILEAHALTVALWGPVPRDGLITYVKPSAVRSINPGCCYKKAGWKKVGNSRDGKPMFRAPPIEQLDWRLWSWKKKRGGKMRIEFTGTDGKK